MILRSHPFYDEYSNWIDNVGGYSTSYGFLPGDQAWNVYGTDYDTYVQVNTGDHLAHVPVMDHMGNVTSVVRLEATPGVGSSARMEFLYDYDAFGKKLRSSNVLAGSTASAASYPFQFSTKFTDAETGLVYYGYRFYDPVNGRWLSRDPIGEEGGLNLYGMVVNNLVEWLDVLGLQGHYGRHHFIAQAGGRNEAKLGKKCPGIDIHDFTMLLWSGNGAGNAAHDVVGGPSYTKMITDLLDDPNLDCCDFLVLLNEIIDIAVSAMADNRSKIALGPSPGFKLKNFDTGDSTTGKLREEIENNCKCKPSEAKRKKLNPAKMKTLNEYKERISDKIGVPVEKLTPTKDLWDMEQMRQWEDEALPFHQPINPAPLAIPNGQTGTPSLPQIPRGTPLRNPYPKPLRPLNPTRQPVHRR